MLKDLPHISQAEWEVMSVLWDRGPLSLPEIIAAVSASSSWHPNTIKTFVRRLVQKGAVDTVGPFGSYRYVARLTRAECLHAENRSFLDRLYGGRLKPMLMALLQHEDLTPDDIAELKAILERKE